MEIRDKSDLISGVLIGAFGLYLVFVASKLTYASEFGPGPGFLPLWLGLALFLLALALIAMSLFSAREAKREARSWAAERRVLGGWLGLMVAIALLPWLGFGLSLALLTAFLIWVLEQHSLWMALSIAIGLAIGFHLVFVSALGLSLPSGPWGF